MMKRTRAYKDVDALAEPEALLPFLDRVETFTGHMQARRRTYEAIPAGSGIDVGCGHGLAVAELVERGVPAVGVDRAAMVRAARRRFPHCTFLEGDATALPFPDASLQWYRAERTYLHISDPAAALAEARRVLAPRSTIVLADQDMESTVITASDPELVRAIVNVFVRDLPQGRIGSRTPGLLAAAGFTDINVSGHPVIFTDFEEIAPYIPTQAAELAVDEGLLTAEQADAWLAELRNRAASKQFLLAYIMFITTARVP